MIRLLTGDCRETLKTLEAGSVQSCITSPPYLGLRDYGTPPLIWSGDPEYHAHEFNSEIERQFTAPPGSAKQASNNGALAIVGRSAFCACGAWLGSLGLEPTPELYIEHLVEVFREVKRVLADSGVCWINLGDSYAGSGNGAHDYRERATSKSPSLKNQHARPLQRVGPQEHTEGAGRVVGYKPKDLMLMPFRVAMALQASGWYVRSCIPWAKGSAMPESVSDRPSTSIEYVFMLSKSARYYYDPDAIRVPASANTHSRGNGTGKKNPQIPFGTGSRNNEDFTSRINEHVSHRNRRNGDWLVESLQGLLLNEEDEPLALLVNPMPFKQAHFATFSTKLVEPMIRASTSERGQCPQCGAPWVRTVDVSRDELSAEALREGRKSKMDATRKDGGFNALSGDEWSATHTRRATGWRASCAHADLTPVPQVVCDPFGGSGTVGLVADRLGRNAILCELKPDYASMATSRLTDDAPLFAEVEGALPMPPTEPITDKQGALGKSTYTGFNARWDAREVAD